MHSSVSTSVKPIVKTIVCVVIAMSALGACSVKDENSVEVIHWWTSGSESKAIKVVAQNYHQQGGTWIDSAVVGSTAARASAINRILGGKPPGAMQWLLGVDMRGLAQQGMLAQIDSVAADGNWHSVLPALVQEKMTFEGHVIAAPTAMHADNWMWSNTKVFTSLGLLPPQTWDEFLRDAPKIKAAGFIPLALGGQPSQEALLFNSVLIGVAGKQAYRKLYVDKDAAFAQDPAVLKAIVTFKALKAFVDDGSPGRAWNDATNMVISGKAAVQFTGDWAKGEFAAAGLTPGKEYGCAMAPGNQDAYVMAVDVFVFPKLGKDDAASAAQAKLAATLLDPVVQAEFSKVKGSVPLRSDVDVSGMDICIQLARKVLIKPENQLPNFAMALSGDTTGAVQDAITKIWNDKSVDVNAASALLASALRQTTAR